MKQLSKELTMFRGPVSRGFADTEPTINRDGGMFGAGLIKGYAIITRGEALGHGVWCDAEFLASIVEAEQDNKLGTKSRLTHPDMSADGLAKGLGRTNNLELDGDTVRGDLHFFQSAHKSPEGNLAEFVMTRTAEDPESLGGSIVFFRDADAEIEFAIEHGATVEDGVLDFSNFKSPDPDNVQNLPHTRLKTFRGVDIVDDPAANPSGMFSSRDTTFSEVESLLDFVIGESDEAPNLTTLDVNPDRVASFFKRYLSNRGLSLMTTETQTTEDSTVENQVDETQTEVTEDQTEATPVETPESPATEQLSSRDEVKRYIAAFGDLGGSWYAEGLTFSECQNKLLGIQREQIAKLNRQVQHENTSDAEGFSTGSTDEGDSSKERKFADLVRFK